MTGKRHAADRRGFSLLEVMVSLGILSILILVASSLLLTLQRGTAVTAALTDTDQDARRVMADIRRELRQSGFHQDDVAQQNWDQLFSVGTLEAGATLTFLQRTDFVNPADYSAAQKLALDWRRGIQYRLVADGSVVAPGGDITTYLLKKRIWVDAGAVTDPGAGVIESAEIIEIDVLRGVSSFVVKRVGNDASELLELEFEVLRTNPDWTTIPPNPVRLFARERVQVQNAKVLDSPWTVQTRNVVVQ